jgi:hypothetical protein
MKRIVLISAALFALGSAGTALAQDKTVAPTVTRESAGTVGGAVSGAAKDAAEEMKKKDAMKGSSDMKAKEAEDAAKMKMKEKMK